MRALQSLREHIVTYNGQVELGHRGRTGRGDTHVLSRSHVFEALGLQCWLCWRCQRCSNLTSQRCVERRLRKRKLT